MIKDLNFCFYVSDGLIIIKHRVYSFLPVLLLQNFWIVSRSGHWFRNYLEITYFRITPIINVIRTIFCRLTIYCRTRVSRIENISHLTQVSQSYPIRGKISIWPGLQLNFNVLAWNYVTNKSVDSVTNHQAVSIPSGFYPFKPGLNSNLN